MQQHASFVSLTGLVISNIGIAMIAIQFDWLLFDVLLLYWLEVGLLGLLNLVQIHYSVGDGLLTPSHQGQQDRFFLIPFFLLHYGALWLACGALLFLLFAGSWWAGVPIGKGWWWAVLLLLGGHLLSLWWDFFAKRLYLVCSPREQMFWIYRRVGLVYLAVATGAIVSLYYPNTTWLLLVLVTAKALADIYSLWQVQKLTTNKGYVA